MTIAAGEYVTLIHRPEDFEPGYAEQAEARFVPAYTAAAARAGFTFRVIPAHQLLPACHPGRPRLWYRGEDLLATRQCFQVDDFSPDPQTAHFLAAVRSTVGESSSLLLNRTAGAPYDLLTDKLAMIQRASRLDVPAPATIAVPYGRHARTAIPLAARELGTGPYIIKPRAMAMGVGVLKADTTEQLTAAADIAAQAGTGYIIQPFVPNDGDVRAYYAGGTVIAAQLRVPAPGQYRANVSQGGTATAYAGLDRLSAWTCRIAASLDASLLAVDWLLTPRGPVLSEWSAGVGGFADLPEPDLTTVGDAYFGWARNRFEETR